MTSSNARVNLLCMNRKTELGRKLEEHRERIKASGASFLSWQDIDRELGRGSNVEGYETAKQAAERLKVVPSRIRQLAIAGRLPGAIKVGRDWLIPKGITPAPFVKEN